MDRTIRVAIVGAGMAGLAAALRLLERGYAVTLYEEKSYLGGKLGAHTHQPDDRRYVGGAHRPGVYYEHCYHMYLNWYHNFWKIAEEIGLDRERDFESREGIRHLRKGAFPHMPAFKNPGSPAYIWENLFAGVQPPADVFLYAYSLIDLLTQRFDGGGLLSRYTVNGFMQSRPYASEGSAALHEDTLAKAFACPSYLTSAASYQSFIKYGMRLPEPMLWVLKGDTETRLHAPLRRRLEALGCEFKLGQSVLDIAVDRRARTLGVVSAPSSNPHLPHPPPPEAPSRPLTSTRLGPKRAELVLALREEPTVEPAGELPPVAARPEPRTPPREKERREYDYVVLAAPPSSVRHLLQSDVELATWFLSERAGVMGKLHSEPMASVDLYLKRNLPELPREHVVLLDSRYGLTFIDNARLWPEVERTALNVVASEFDALVDLPEEAAFLMIFHELTRYLPITLADVESWHIQANVGDELFVNEVGSDQWRPGARTSLPNLFLAGDYCRTFVDVVTVEGAVVAGLEAARALQAQALADWGFAADDRRARPIEVIPAQAYPDWMLLSLKLLLAPYAVAAKCWSWANEETRAVASGQSPAAPTRLPDAAAALVTAPYLLASEVWRAGWSFWSGLLRGSRDAARTR
jgi:hypothetical protein